MTVWRRLLVSTPAGWALGIVAGVALIIAVESMGLQGVQSPLVLGVGLGVSAQQYRAMQQSLDVARWQWIVLSSLGLVAPFAVVDAASLGGRALPYDLVSFVVVGGVCMSVMQWLLLRARFRRAGLWLIASPAGFVAAAATLALNDRALPKTPGIAGALQYLGVVMVGGVLLGIATAIAAARFEPRSAGTRTPDAVTTVSPDRM